MSNRMETNKWGVNLGLLGRALVVLFLLFVVLFPIKTVSADTYCRICPGAVTTCMVCDSEPNPECPALPRINIIDPMNHNTYSTKDLGNKRLFFNVSIGENGNETVQKITLIVNGAKSYSSVLCNDCSRVQGYTEELKLGNYQICFKVLTQPLGPCQGNNFVPFSTQKCVYVKLTDETLPKITDYSPRFYPEEGNITNGVFSIIYNTSMFNSTSDFNITLTLESENGSILEFEKNDCPVGENEECSFNVDLTNLDGEEIEYYFTIIDYRDYKVSTRTNRAVVLLNPADFIIASPVNNTVYNHSVIDLDVDLVSRGNLYYSIDGSGFTQLCSSCDSYEGQDNFDDGPHTITFRVISNNEVFEKTINFFVDTTPPRIVSVDNPEITNSEFHLVFSEENVRAVLFLWRIVGVDEEFQAIKLDCSSTLNGQSRDCYAVPDLFYSMFYPENNTIEYYFVIFDLLTNTTSSIFDSQLDIKAPSLVINSPESRTYNDNVININVEVDEESDIYYSLDSNQFILICDDCTSVNQPHYFSNGEHDLGIKAVDKAGNTVVDYVHFNVI